MPLVRVADDLLVLCLDRKDAAEAHRALTDLLRPAGMPLKGSPETAIRDLAGGEDADWLGFSLGMGSAGLEARLPEEGRCWRELAEALALAHAEPDAPIRVQETIRGWIGQLGPCYAGADARRAYARASVVARDLAFEEVPAWESVQSHPPGPRRAEVTGPRRWLDRQGRPIPPHLSSSRVRRR
jgi:hypothetical protein